MTLDDHLTACARASGLRIGVTTPAHHALRRAFEQDETLRARARRRLAAMPPLPKDCDHVGRWVITTLEGALPKESA